MNNNIIICGTGIYFSLLKSRFVEYGMNAEICPDDKNIIIKNLCNNKYSAVVISDIDRYMKKSELISEISRFFPETSIVVLSYNSLYEDCSKLIDAGTEKCIIMPQNVTSVCDIIMNMLNDTHLYMQEIADFLEFSGFSGRLDGFYYLCAATEICIMNCPKKVSDIYRLVAERFETDISIVERSLRHLIKTSYNKGITDKFFSDRNSRPSNSELIYAVSEVLIECSGDSIKKGEINKISP